MALLFNQILTKGVNMNKIPDYLYARVYYDEELPRSWWQWLKGEPVKYKKVFLTPEQLEQEKLKYL